LSYTASIDQVQRPQEAPRRRWSTLGLLLLGGAFLGAAIGYLLARLFPESHGAAPSCPGGAPASSCFYPPNQGSHQVVFAIGGAILLILIAWIVWRQLLDDRW
jgi:hypothetical protein